MSKCAMCISIVLKLLDFTRFWWKAQFVRFQMSKGHRSVPARLLHQVSKWKRLHVKPVREGSHLGTMRVVGANHETAWIGEPSRMNGWAKKVQIGRPCMSFCFSLISVDYGAAACLRQFIPLCIHTDVLSMFFKMMLSFKVSDSHLSKYILRSKTRKICCSHHTNSVISQACTKYMTFPFQFLLALLLVWSLCWFPDLDWKTHWKEEQGF